MRVYKSGKFYLIRANLKTNTSNELELKIYDEEQHHLEKEEFTNKSKIVSILEICGIKFTQQKFQIEIVLKQCMIINDEIMFEGCLINTNNRLLKNKNNLVERNVNVNENTNDSINLVKVENNQENDKKEEIKNTHSNKEENKNEYNENNLEDFNNSIETVQEKLQFIENNNKNNKESTEYEIENDNDSLTEIDPFDDVKNLLNDEKIPMKIKQPNEIYYEMYKKARLEAKEAKQKAQKAYLEAKQIKDLHLLDISDSDSSDSDTDINELYK